MFNHLEVNRGICQKTGLIRSLSNYYERNEQARLAGYSVFDSTPTTFVVARNYDDMGIRDFLHRFREISKGNFRTERVPPKHCEQNMWLVKPAYLNQGRGIEIFRNHKEVTDFIFSTPQSIPFWVVQKYVEKPFLYNTRKFDIRVWAVVTDDFRIYFYNQGYIRTASSNYDLKNQNNYVHLTNQCLQIKDKENYGTHEEGNTLSFEEL